MNTRRPDIFVSATSADLRTCRQLVKEALLTLGCVPVEQTNFPPDHRTVREMLRARIAGCDAVLHIAGECYGAEPRMRAPGEPRRSYTQLEYDLARELGKPLYVFLCGDDFVFDEHPAEDPEKQDLQRAHRAALATTETLRTRVHTRDELAQRVRELQTHVERLTGELARTRTWLGRGALVGLVVLAVLGGTIWTLNRRAADSDEHAARLEDELARMRQSLEAVANRYNQPAPGDEQLDDEQRFERALAAVAEEKHVEIAALKTAVESFVTQVRGNPAADFYDRALADFAERHFGEAAANATQAAEVFRAERAAAERDLAASAERARTARRKEREALTLAGDAYRAAAKFPEAERVLQDALALVDRSADPLEWAALQLKLAHCHWELATRLAGSAINDHLEAGAAGCRAALEIYSRDNHAGEWALAQGTLGNVLRNQARARGGAEGAALLGESVAAYRAALEVGTRETRPRDWLFTQNNLGIALYDQAALSAGSARTRLLVEAATAFRAALEVASPERTPTEWAKLHNNLGNTLWVQGTSESGPRAGELLDEAAEAFRAAIAVRTREEFPEDWARIHNNLANLFVAQAQLHAGPERTALLQQAVDAQRAALEVFTLDRAPQMWALSRHNLGFALSLLAQARPPADRRRTVAEAIDALESALAVHTRQSLPFMWAMNQYNLGSALAVQAYGQEGAAREPGFARALASLRAGLEVHTRETVPQEWARTHFTIGFVLWAQAEPLPAGTERTALLEEAAAAARLACAAFTRENAPVEWASAAVTLGAILRDQARDARDATRAQEAVALIRGAAEVLTRDALPLYWAVTQHNLGSALTVLVETDASTPRAPLLTEAIGVIRASLEVLTPEEAAEDFRRATESLARAEAASAAR